MYRLPPRPSECSRQPVAGQGGQFPPNKQSGRPWTSHGFQASWRMAARKAGIVEITFHDLRGTAVTRLAIVGCTEAEIATITGHSLRDVRSILDAHYLARDPALAESAIRKLERGTKTPN
jgi:integrase